VIFNPGTIQVGRPEIFLHPGQKHVATGRVTLKMILGSCAGIFLFDRRLRIGGATHFMLPRHGTGQASPRYGDVAIPALLEQMCRLGSLRGEIQAKVYGGASMLSALRGLQGDHFGHIGRRNVETSLTILAEASIAVVEKDVLGERGRKVSMISDTGAITLEYVSHGHGN
jgi:chemotaxis protein CheD